MRRQAAQCSVTLCWVSSEHYMPAPSPVLAASASACKLPPSSDVQDLAGWRCLRLQSSNTVILWDQDRPELTLDFAAVQSRPYPCLNRSYCCITYNALAINILIFQNYDKAVYLLQPRTAVTVDRQIKASRK